jgi:hypothetical protein
VLAERGQYLDLTLGQPGRPLHHWLILPLAGPGWSDCGEVRGDFRAGSVVNPCSARMAAALVVTSLDGKAPTQGGTNVQQSDDR